MDEKVFQCDNSGCSKECKTCAGKWKHLRTCNLPLRQAEEKDEQKQYTKDEKGHIFCKKCPKSYTKLANFYHHKKEVHLNTKIRARKKTYMCCLFQNLSQAFQTYTTYAIS